MGKLKKEILINKKEYSVNKARKFLADKLKQNNTMKCDINKIIKFLSKRENFEVTYIVGSEIYTINVVIIPYKENKNRINKYGENIYLKRNKIKDKIAEYNSIANKIFNNEAIKNQMKNSFIKKIKEAKETAELFDCKINIFNKNGEFVVEKRNSDYLFKFLTEDSDIYIAFYNLKYNSLKDIEQKIKNIKKIKENLEI